MDAGRSAGATPCIGRWKWAPAAARTTLGLNGSTVSPVSSTSWTPAASRSAQHGPQIARIGYAVEDQGQVET